MTEEKVRHLIARKAVKAGGLRPWCRLVRVASPHVSEFLNGKRGPSSELLEALGLEYRIMRKAKVSR